MTPQQAKLHTWLLARADNPVSPSFEEMQAAMGMGSKSGVSRLLAALEQDGLIVRDRNRARSIRAVERDPLRGVTSAALIRELKRRGEWPNGR